MSEREHLQLVQENQSKVAKWATSLKREQEEAQADATRLREFESKEQAEALADSEEDERGRIERRQASRARRMEHFQRELDTAQDDIDLRAIQEESSRVVAATKAWWETYLDWKRQERVFLEQGKQLHLQQEALRQRLPRSANALATTEQFPSWEVRLANLDATIGSEGPQCQALRHAMLPIPLLSKILEHDVGCREMNLTYLQRRVREVAEARKAV